VLPLMALQRSSIGWLLLLLVFACGFNANRSPSDSLVSPFDLLNASDSSTGINDTPLKPVVDRPRLSIFAKTIWIVKVIAAVLLIIVCIVGSLRVKRAIYHPLRTIDTDEEFDSNDHFFRTVHEDTGIELAFDVNIMTDELELDDDGTDYLNSHRPSSSSPSRPLNGNMNPQQPPTFTSASHLSSSHHHHHHKPYSSLSMHHDGGI